MHILKIEFFIRLKISQNKIKTLPKKGQVKHSETSKIWEIFFQDFSFGNKKTRNNFPDIPFSICHFFIFQFFFFNILKYRNSRSQMFFKIGFLKKFEIFKRKHLCWSLFFNKVAGLRPAILLKRRLQLSCFLANIEEFLRTAFYVAQLRWLLLKAGNSFYICVLYCFQSLLMCFFPSAEIYNFQNI